MLNRILITCVLSISCICSSASAITNARNLTPACKAAWNSFCSVDSQRATACNFSCENCEVTCGRITNTRDKQRCMTLCETRVATCQANGQRACQRATDNADARRREADRLCGTVSTNQFDGTCDGKCASADPTCCNNSRQSAASNQSASEDIIASFAAGNMKLNEFAAAIGDAAVLEYQECTGAVASENSELNYGVKLKEPAVTKGQIDATSNEKW